MYRLEQTKLNTSDSHVNTCIRIKNDSGERIRKIILDSFNKHRRCILLF